MLQNCPRATNAFMFANETLASFRCELCVWAVLTHWQAADAGIGRVGRFVQFVSFARCVRCLPPATACYAMIICVRDREFMADYIDVDLAVEIGMVWIWIWMEACI